MRNGMLELERISCHDFIEFDGYAWFSNWFYNGLFQVEIETGKTKFLGGFEDEKPYARNIHWETFKRDEKIYFCPWKGRHLHTYDLTRRSLQSIEIRKESEGFFTVQDILLAGNEVFCVPEQQNAKIKRIDLQSQKVTEVNRKVDLQGKKISERREAFPAAGRIEELHTGHADEFFWRRSADKKWHAFLPEGRRLLCYMEESDELETIPLTLINGDELEAYLYRVKKEQVKRKIATEKAMRYEEFFKILENEKICRETDLSDRVGVGKTIWETICQAKSNTAKMRD